LGNCADIEKPKQVLIASRDRPIPNLLGVFGLTNVPLLPSQPQTPECFWTPQKQALLIQGMNRSMAESPESSFEILQNHTSIQQRPNNLFYGTTLKRTLCLTDNLPTATLAIA
jgi:hypothetical protein